MLLFVVFLSLLLIGSSADSVLGEDRIVEKCNKAYHPRNAHFYDSFDDLNSWEKSGDKKFEGAIICRTDYPDDDKSVIQKGLPGDHGMLFKDDARSHAISAKFDTLFDVKDKDYVIQYEVRPHEHLICSGAYIKLLRKTDDEFDPKTFNGDTPYAIMFGPDKCGEKDKVHFIYTYKNPISGKFYEHHLKDAPQMINDQKTHLYTLIIRKDNSFEMLIDQKNVKKGNLLEDFDPPVTPSTEIDDPNDIKPADWVEDAQIMEPDAVKPENQDENAPRKIIDENAKMPSDQLEDESKTIPDPDSKKPSDQNSEFDGDWEAPIIENPKCVSVGCGPWTPPEIDNPEYKGKWAPPMIDNPEYKGQQSPRKIPNPDWFEAKEPHNLQPMIAVGFELWLVQANIEFDNVFISNDVDAASELADNTFIHKQNFEENLKSEDESGKSESDGESWYMDLVLKITEYIKNNAAISIAIMFGLIPILLFCCKSSKPKEQNVNADVSDKNIESVDETTVESSADSEHKLDSILSDDSDDDDSLADDSFNEEENVSDKENESEHSETVVEDEDSIATADSLTSLEKMTKAAKIPQKKRRKPRRAD